MINFTGIKCYEKIITLHIHLCLKQYVLVDLHFSLKEKDSFIMIIEV